MSLLLVVAAVVVPAGQTFTCTLPEAHLDQADPSRRGGSGAGGRDRQACQAAYAAPQPFDCLPRQALRRAFATHLLEDGTDIRIIQALLGHGKLENTAFYTKVATRTVRAVTSPLDKLGLFMPSEAAPPG